MDYSAEFGEAILTLLKPWATEFGECPGRLTAKMVEEAEQRVGHKLPTSYLALLAVQNGGYPRRRLHPRVNGEVQSIMGIGDVPEDCIGWYSWEEVLGT